MRVLLLVFLMMALPFQSVWSAAAAVCAHEQAVASPHFGHHAAHHHDDDSHGSHGNESKSDPSSTASDDHHHLLSVYPIPSMPVLPLALEINEGVRPPGAERYPHASIAALERPPRDLADIRSVAVRAAVPVPLISGGS